SLLALSSSQAKTDETAPSLPAELQGPFRQLQEAARQVDITVTQPIRSSAKISIETEEYVNSFTASMMEATYAWSNGAKFSEVIELTDDFEGSIIRVFRRLEELLRQLAQVGDAVNFRHEFVG
ncbi:unnamed protein product, partial [Hapterophycus canaliculatus]